MGLDPAGALNASSTYSKKNTNAQANRQGHHPTARVISLLGWR